MKFLARVQGHLFLVVEDEIESAKAEVEKMFGKVDFLDLSQIDEDFILEVDILDGSQLGFLKLDNGGN